MSSDNAHSQTHDSAEDSILCLVREDGCGVDYGRIEFAQVIDFLQFIDLRQAGSAYGVGQVGSQNRVGAQDLEF